MEIARVDEDGHLLPFTNMDAASPNDVQQSNPASPAVENEIATTADGAPQSGSRKRKERSMSISEVHNEANADEDAGSESDASLLTPISDLAEDAAPRNGPTLRGANARKKADAPTRDSRDGANRSEAPAKRTRASAHQRGEDVDM